MTMNKKLLIPAALAVTAAAVAVHIQQNLYVNGVPTPSDIRMIDGHAYVRLTDAAKALNMHVNEKPDGFELIAAGGANQMANRFTGKMGEDIFTGRWRLKIFDVKRAKSYHMTLATDHDLQAGDGEDLVIVDGQVKNGTQEKDELVFESVDGMNTSLTDQNAQSYAVAGWDVKASETYPVGAQFLPGAAIEFTLVFKVPESAKPKDLIFTAMRYSMRTTYHQSQEKPEDIRVSLDSPGS